MAAKGPQAGSAQVGLGPVVELSARRFAVPFQCPCCGAAPDAELAVPVTRMKDRQVADDSAHRLEFPYCRRCLAHSTSWHGAGVVPAGITLGGIIAGVAIAIMANVIAGLLLIVAAVAIAYGLLTNRRAQATAMCGPACPSADAAVVYLGWSGTTSSFAFRSPTYTARFAEDNTAKLVNASAALKRLLEGHRVARLAVPTPAAAMTVPPPRTAREWVGKIEGAPTRFARRRNLENALEMTQDPAEKQELVAAATRAELAPVRGKLEQLGGGARTRYLAERIAELSADNLPAELQEAVLAELVALGQSGQ